VATKLGERQLVGTYSLDLSAAFDLLRPDVFYKLMDKIIPTHPLYVLMDFLRGRSFKV